MAGEETGQDGKIYRALYVTKQVLASCVKWEPLENLSTGVSGSELSFKRISLVV